MRFLNNLTPKTKHYLAWALIAASIIAAAMIGKALMDRNKTPKPLKPAKPRMSILKDKIDKDAWMASESNNIKAIQKGSEETRSQIIALKEEVGKLQKSLEEERKGKAGEDKSPGEDHNGKSTLKKPEQPLLKVPLPSSTKKDNTQDQVKLLKPEEFPPKDAKGKLALPQPSGKGTPVEPGTIRVFIDETPNKKKEDKKKSVKDQVFLPAGSFMKSVLLNGIDAPTSDSAQAEPYPVLLSIQDLNILPNRHRVDLVECFVIGAGYGNLSDERAYIRTENLSCVKKDGKVLDISLKGHVIGEDGKLGMRGRLVSKQGQQIAYALLAGTLASFSQAFRPTENISVNITDQGRTSGSLSFGDQLLGAGEWGAARAFNKVADFYLKMADKIYPVVEIDAGRTVEVIILKGQNLQITNK